MYVNYSLRYLNFWKCLWNEASQNTEKIIENLHKNYLDIEILCGTSLSKKYEQDLIMLGEGEALSISNFWILLHKVIFISFVLCDKRWKFLKLSRHNLQIFSELVTYKLNWRNAVMNYTWIHIIKYFVNDNLGHNNYYELIHQTDFKILIILF